jgi:8-oxo-dGTP diphosphatase
MIRRYGEPVRAGQRYTLRPGVYGVIVRPADGSLLLTHQREPDDEFQLPGGGIDPGEGPLQALIREVTEETGWTIAGARRLGAFRRFTFMPEYGLWAEKICMIYAARPARRRGPPSEPGHSAHWVPPAMAAEILANAGDAAFVRHHLALSRHRR